MKRLTLTLAAALAASMILAPVSSAGIFDSLIPWGMQLPSTSGDRATAAWSIMPPGNGNIYGPTAAHVDDQREMYDGVTNAAANGTLTPSTLGLWMKPAKLGMSPLEFRRSELPRSDVKLMWDNFGVPHIEGKSDYAAGYGAGWANAEARYPIMELLRVIGRSGVLETEGTGALTKLVDAILSGNTSPFESLTLINYSDAELKSGLDRTFADATPQDAVIIAQSLDGYVDGINDYIRRNFASIPPIADALDLDLGRYWSAEDVAGVGIAIRDLFGDGGGSEIHTAALLEKLDTKFGSNGRRVFDDLGGLKAETNFHTSNTFPYPKFAAPASPTDDTDAATLGPVAKVDSGSVSGHVDAERARPSASNYLLLGGSRTKDGRPLLVGGPQVAYFYPQILFEMEIRSPSIRARGIVVPGQGPVIIAGRTAHYAWSPTAGGSDTTDQRIELLCEPDGSPATTASRAVRFNGRCVPMTRPAGARSNTAWRSPHGPVLGYGKSEGRPVAVAQQRSGRYDSPTSAISFLRLSRDIVRDADDFARELRHINLSLNMGYVNSREIAYAHTGWYPVRAQGVDPKRPSWGTGKWEWRGLLDWSEVPHVVNPANNALTSWNNYPAPGWEPESPIGHGPVHRDDLLYVPATQASGVTAAGALKIAQTAATQDLRGVAIVPQLRELFATRAPASDDARLGWSMLSSWEAAGSHRRDLNYDRFTDDPAVTVMNEFYPRLVNELLGGSLGPDILSMLGGADDAPSLQGSAYNGGLYGPIKQELQRATGELTRPAGLPAYCGDGSATDCATIASRLLSESVAAVRSAQTPLTQAFPGLWLSSQLGERIRFLPIITNPLSMRWQNRPTFQQISAFSD
ncbi:MAG: penicillin acylase family protein [Thermoleophilaceae bacterium]|nr:penicillin acylase family protein [Thermoleophilaceae bacterium]